MSRLAQTISRQKSLLGPALIIFVSANIANVANLAFNMLFARLMTPGEFADLTLLMSIKLGLLTIFSALQYGISEITAKSSRHEAREISASLTRKSLLFSIPLCLLLIIGAQSLAHVLNFKDQSALICLFLAIPLFLPMIIFRGLAQGQLHLPKMVWSFQTEWIIRLFGCWLLWMAGFGMTGITVALVASIVTGLIFTMDREDLQALRHPHKGRSAVLKTTAPYLIIFLAQVLVLDGDIFIAKAYFSENVAGGAAGLLLVQRIFFFAFLSLATVVQPLVASQSRSREHANQTLLKVLAMVVLICGGALMCLALQPEVFVGLFLGHQYTNLSSMVVIAGAIGGCFVCVQLAVVAMLAQGQKWAPNILIGLTLIYYSCVGVMMQMEAGLDYGTLLHIKLGVFGAGFMAIGLNLIRQIRA